MRESLRMFLFVLLACICSQIHAQRSDTLSSRFSFRQCVPSPEMEMDGRGSMTDNPLLDTVKVNGTEGFRNGQHFRTPIMALRSNLLLPLMNIGVEVPLSNRFSLGADWYYPWAMRRWTNSVLPSQMYCAQMLLWSIEGRWWLGAIHAEDADTRYRLRGHSIAMLALGGYYDIEYGGSGQQGELFGLGVDYMYSLPLGKGGVHVEFSLGAGCLWNPYRNYKVRTEGGYLIGDGEQSLSRLRPAPIRIGISLSIPVSAGKEAER